MCIPLSNHADEMNYSAIVAGIRPHLLSCALFWVNTVRAQISNLTFRNHLCFTNGFILIILPGVRNWIAYIVFPS